MDQVHLPDPIMNELKRLKEENEMLKKRMAEVEEKVKKGETYENL